MARLFASRVARRVDWAPIGIVTCSRGTVGAESEAEQHVALHSQTPGGGNESAAGKRALVLAKVALDQLPD